MTLAKHTPEERRRLALALAVFLLYLFYMCSQVNFYLYRSLRTTYYAAAVPVVVAGTIYFRRGKDGWEARLLLAYWLWFLLSRALNHNLALVDDDYLCFDLSLMIPFLAVGLSLSQGGRRRFLNWFSAAVGGYHFLLGLICLATFLMRRQFVNPITGGLIGMAKASGYERINILDINADSTAYWFMTGLLMMLYAFFACRRKLWRVPIVLCALVCWAVVAITYTRSVRVALATVFALLAVLLCFRRWRPRSRLALVLVLILIFLVTAVLVYKSFDLATTGLSALSQRVRADGAAQAAAAPAAARDAAGAVRTVSLASGGTEAASLYDRLNKLSSKRLEIYRCAFLTIREDPMILLRGCLSKDSMATTNAILQRKHPVPHFHNFLFQTLILTGLPGLLLVLAFCLLVIRKVVRLFFSRDARVMLADKSLCLLVTAPLVYCLFEACLFTEVDVRPLFFFVVCGMFLGTYDHYNPPPLKES